MWVQPSKNGIDGDDEPRHWWGFTLVELLIVIGIVAILMSLLLPTLARAKTVAKSAKCQGNLRQIGIGLRMYVDDWGRHWNGGGYASLEGPRLESWVDYVGVRSRKGLSREAKYRDADHISYCPRGSRRGGLVDPGNSSRWLLPRASYGYNRTGTSVCTNCPSPGNLHLGLANREESAVVFPSVMRAMGCAGP